MVSEPSSPLSCERLNLTSASISSDDLSFLMDVGDGFFGFAFIWFKSSYNAGIGPIGHLWMDASYDIDECTTNLRASGRRKE
jgi:hypothetical protein